MDGVIATTPEAASLVPNTTKVVFHGASLERFTPPENKSTAWQGTGLPGKLGIGLFGRIRPTKGTDIFVDAMIKVLPYYPDFTAIITGQALASEDNYKHAMDEKIRAAGLAERIIFLGNLAADQIPIWYQNVAIMVACPRYEPFGITPLEAMASGCAVVASRTGAFEYIVLPGETGELVPTGDVDALGLAVKKLMSDTRTIEHIGRAGRARVTAEFSIEKEAQGIADVYRTVLQAE
jgi:mannosyltransferase